MAHWPVNKKIPPIIGPSRYKPPISFCIEMNSIYDDVFNAYIKKKPLNAKGILINTAGLFQMLFWLWLKVPRIYPPPLKPLMKIHKPRAYKYQFTVCIHGFEKKMPDILIFF